MPISHVLLFLTYRCNLRCEFCLSFKGFWCADRSIPLPAAVEPRAFFQPGNRTQEMGTADIVERVIPQCEKSGVEAIALSGGEVLVRKDALDIFRALEASSMRWCLDSNLMLCNELAAETVIASRCDAVFASFDGGRDIHNKLRRSPRAFDEALNGLHRLLEARRRVDKPCCITINFVLQPGNEREPENMVRLALEWGVDELRFQLLSGRAYTAPFDVEAAASSLRTALAVAGECGLIASVYPLPHPDENDLRVWYSMPLTDRFYKGCKYVQRNLRIDPAGNVIPCMEYKVGNILEQDLLEIWFGSSYQIFRRNVTDNGPFEACLRCCNMNNETIS